MVGEVATFLGSVWLDEDRVLKIITNINFVAFNVEKKLLRVCECEMYCVYT